MEEGGKTWRNVEECGEAWRIAKKQLRNMRNDNHGEIGERGSKVSRVSKQKEKVTHRYHILS